MVAPLIWLLVFDLIVCIAWWFIFNVMGVTGPEPIKRIMVGLVVAINVIVLVVWLLQLLGVAPTGFLQGPYGR